MILVRSRYYKENPLGQKATKKLSECNKMLVLRQYNKSHVCTEFASPVPNVDHTLQRAKEQLKPNV